MLLVMGAFTSCSSHDEYPLSSDTPPTPNFELVELEAYDLSLLDSEDFIIIPMEFTSSAAWRLSSDKIWVLFSDTEDGIFYNDLVGGQGTNKVFVKITNQARTFESSDANICCYYNDAEYKLSSISRPAKMYESSIFDEDGNQIEDEIEIDGSASMTITINTNYAFGIKSYPEWIQEPELYDGGYILKVKDAYTPYALEGEVVIANADNTMEQVIPVKYTGMSPEDITISGSYSPWGWNVSLDGKVFLLESESSSMDGESTETTVDNALPFAVKCFNYDYEIVFAEVDANDNIKYQAEGWLTAEKSEADNASIEVKASSFVPSAASRSRKGYIFAVPTGIYESFMASLEAATDAITFVDENEKYVVVEVEQRDIYAIDGFIITTAAGTAVECIEEPAGDYYDWVSSELSVSDVYTFTAENEVTYLINTLYTPADKVDGFYFYDSKTGNAVSSRTWKYSRALNEEGYYVISLTVPVASKFVDPVILRLHHNNENKKALIIRPVNN